jgi:hypothetical protein
MHQLHDRQVGPRRWTCASTGPVDAADGWQIINFTTAVIGVARNRRRLRIYAQHARSDLVARCVVVEEQDGWVRPGDQRARRLVWRAAANISTARRA